MTGKLKQNLVPGQRVTFARTNSELDDLCGTILGISAAHPLCDFYIVGLDAPLANGWTAITMIESCIERLSNGGPL